MHLPKHSNPHLISDAIRIVSRKSLQDDSDGDAARLDSREMEDLHATLDNIVSKRLKLKRNFAPSDEPHSSKRHKASANGVEPQQHSEPVGEFIY
jgi:hypothetical protein